MKARIKAAFEGFFDWLVPPGQARLTEGLRQRLVADPLTIVDVGAVYGPDPRWTALGERTCRFITFEPDRRSTEASSDDGPFRMLALSTALGKETARRPLYLTDAPFCSSLYLPNEAILSDFGTWPWYLPIGTDEVAVDTLDHCLADRPDWAPDFIKSDVEGADLDVLIGAERTLGMVLGAQIEVAFVERNLGAPLFAQSDVFLRDRGFTLFQLIREHWVRTNGVIGKRSRQQLIWGDAIYVRGADDFRTRLAAAAAERREGLLVKFVAMLLVHGYHDYAAQTVEDAARAGFCAPPLKREFDVSIAASVAHPRFFLARAWIATLLTMLLRLIALPFGTAARRRMRDLYVRYGAQLFFVLYRESMRGGLDRSCVTDLA